MTRISIVSLVLFGAMLPAACAGTPAGAGPDANAVAPDSLAPPLGAPSFTRLPAVGQAPAIGVSAQPSDGDLAAARAAGYRTVVNFRAPGEPGFVDERAAVEALGMRYVAIPVSGIDATTDHADALAPILADGAADGTAGPILMHCRSGTRAKLVWTLWLARQGGLSPQAALEQGRRAGLSGDAAGAAERLLK